MHVQPVAHSYGRVPVAVMYIFTFYIIGLE